MKLADQIKLRKLSFTPKVEVDDNAIELSDIGIVVPIPKGFTLDDGSTFETFKNNHEFPENSEFSNEDRRCFEDGLFPPLFLLKKQQGRPLIACYLFPIRALKGSSHLNIRSINKFELMWAPYLIKKTNLVPMNAKRIIKNELKGALSTEYGFDYKAKNAQEGLPSMLRVLTYELGRYVLSFYIISNATELMEQTELEAFINGIKKMDKKPSNRLWQTLKSTFKF